MYSQQYVYEVALPLQTNIINYLHWLRVVRHTILVRQDYIKISCTATSIECTDYLRSALLDAEGIMLSNSWNILSKPIVWQMVPSHMFDGYNTRNEWKLIFLANKLHQISHDCIQINIIATWFKAIENKYKSCRIFGAFTPWVSVVSSDMFQLKEIINGPCIIYVAAFHIH